jgi:hypothetical protein
MTEVEVTLLNVGGINNSPLEYYSGMSDAQINAMDALLVAAINSKISELPITDPPFNKEYFAVNPGNAQMVEYQTKLYDEWKALLMPNDVLGVKGLFKTSLDDAIFNKHPLNTMPEITSRFRASISGLDIFDNARFIALMGEITKEGSEDLTKIVTEYYNKYVLIDTRVPPHPFMKDVEGRHWNDEPINVEDKTEELKQYYFRLGVLFDIYAHIATLFYGYYALTDKHVVNELVKQYGGISQKILTNKTAAIKLLLSTDGTNKVVLLNECYTGTTSVDPHSYATHPSTLHAKTYGKKYSAVCCLGNNVSLDFDNTCKQIKKIIETVTLKKGGKTVAAEGAVGMVKVGETNLYFVSIHCNSWMDDETPKKSHDRANLIKKLLDELHKKLSKEKIIIGIDTNTGHIQNSELQTGGNPALDTSNDNPWRILAPEQVNENKVLNGTSSEKYYTVNQRRSFFQSQLGKAGVLDKKTKDLILGLNINEFKDLEILEYTDTSWVTLSDNSHAPNLENPFDHYAVRVKIRVGVGVVTNDNLKQLNPLLDIEVDAVTFKAKSDSKLKVTQYRYNVPAKLIGKWDTNNNDNWGANDKYPVQFYYSNPENSFEDYKEANKEGLYVLEGMEEGKYSFRPTTFKYGTNIEIKDKLGPPSYSPGGSKIKALRGTEYEADPIFKVPRQNITLLAEQITGHLTTPHTHLFLTTGFTLPTISYPLVYQPTLFGGNLGFVRGGVLYNANNEANNIVSDGAYQYKDQSYSHYPVEIVTQATLQAFMDKFQPAVTPGKPGKPGKYMIVSGGNSNNGIFSKHLCSPYFKHIVFLTGYYIGKNWEKDWKKKGYIGVCTGSMSYDNHASYPNKTYTFDYMFSYGFAYGFKSKIILTFTYLNTIVDQKDFKDYHDVPITHFTDSWTLLHHDGDCYHIPIGKTVVFDTEGKASGNYFKEIMLFFLLHGINHGGEFESGNEGIAILAGGGVTVAKNTMKFCSLLGSKAKTYSIGAVHSHPANKDNRINVQDYKDDYKNDTGTSGSFPIHSINDSITEYVSNEPNYLNNDAEIVFGERQILFYNGDKQESTSNVNKFSLDETAGNDNMNFLVVNDNESQDTCDMIKHTNLTKNTKNLKHSYGIKGNFNKVEDKKLIAVITWCSSAYELIVKDQLVADQIVPV